MNGFGRGVNGEKEKRKSGSRKSSRAKLSIVAAACVLVLCTTVAAQPPSPPPSPFLIYGWVKYSNGTEVRGPNVKITNLNTSEDYTVETNASYSYYQVIISSYNVSEGDVLYFNASDDGNSIDRTVTVTSGNMADGGLFEQNLTIKVGICGDVNCDGYVTGYDSDLILLYLYKGYSLEDEWAADVNADGFITGYDSDLILLYLYKGYELRCS